MTDSAGSAARVRRRWYDIDHRLFAAPRSNEIVRLADKYDDCRSAADDMAKPQPCPFLAAMRRSFTRANEGRIALLSLFDHTGQWSRPWGRGGLPGRALRYPGQPETGDVNAFGVNFFSGGSVTSMAWISTRSLLPVHVRSSLSVARSISPPKMRTAAPSPPWNLSARPCVPSSITVLRYGPSLGPAASRNWLGCHLDAWPSTRITQGIHTRRKRCFGGASMRICR